MGLDTGGTFKPPICELLDVWKDGDTGDCWLANGIDSAMVPIGVWALEKRGN
jgi:hypothetical protein